MQLGWKARDKANSFSGWSASSATNPQIHLRTFLICVDSFSIYIEQEIFLCAQKNIFVERVIYMYSISQIHLWILCCTFIHFETVLAPLCVCVCVCVLLPALWVSSPHWVWGSQPLRWEEQHSLCPAELSWTRYRLDEVCRQTRTLLSIFTYAWTWTHSDECVCACVCYPCPNGGMK